MLPHLKCGDVAIESWDVQTQDNQFWIVSDVFIHRPIPIIADDDLEFSPKIWDNRCVDIALLSTIRTVGASSSWTSVTRTMVE